jgi:hypothetical protein
MRHYAILFLLLLAGRAEAQKIQKLIREADVARVLATLSHDSMEGRKPQTAGIRKAADFLAAAFRKAGLQPLEGMHGSFLQSFTVNQFQPDSQRVVFNGAEMPRESVICFPAAELVRWENQGADIVQIGPGEKAAEKLIGLLRGGKPAVVVVDTSHRAALTRFRNFRPNRLEGAATVVAVLTSEPLRDYRVSLLSKKNALPYANVAGMIPGWRSDEVVVFSAHYDHLGIGKPKNQDSIYNGANDDASGTTAVVMLARYFQQQRKPERTLVFVAFTAEESGGYGSQYFSRQLDPDKVVAMFNIEMIGTDSKWGKNSAFITGFEKSDFGTMLQENLKGSVFRFEPDPYPTQQLFYRSDNATLARLGVPAHTISTSKMDAEPYYHTVDDEVETLDTKNMTEIIKAIAISSKGIVSGKQTPRRVTGE